MKILKSMLLSAPALAGSVLLGCGASRPSTELVNARTAYAQARSSEAATYSPARVLSAKQALDRAERAYRDDPGSFDEKSLAYIAQRRSELAMAYGDLARAERERQSAQALYQQRQAALRQNAEQTLEETQSDLESARRDLAAQGAARAEAERRLAEVMQSLSSLGEVKQDGRGTVLTLEGGVLFQSAKSTLMPPARERLEQVAHALAALDPAQTIIIEGHTDSRGADEMNQRLSQARADAVRDYLVERGVRPERIRAEGHGEEQPIADNESAEGRANNRRVEIVIAKMPATPQGPGSSRPAPSAPGTGMDTRN
jgi:outer membrane protein OmpA-like peptidoglycan-associated protein